MSSRRSRPADDDVLSLVRAAAAIPATAAREKASRDRVLSAIGSRPPWIGLTSTGLLAAAILLIVSAAVWRVRSSRQDASLAWTATPDEIRFVDGTRVGLDSGSDLTVVDAREHHIRATLTKGIVRRMTPPKADVSWIIQAGSYSVEVGAARFELGMSPASHEMSLVVFDGEARIDGVPSAPGVKVSPGTRAVIDTQTNILTLAPLETSAATVNAQEPQPVASVAEPPPPVAGGHVAAKSDSGWPYLVRHGDFAEVVRRAGERGVDACIARCSLDDLRALGDAARYQGEAALAIRALTALHTRSSAPLGRAESSLLIGRTEESSGHPADALRWYDRSLGESSSGAVANEALAGRMRATDAVRGREAARTVARDYLTRFPEGVHADAARRLLGGS